MVNKTTNVAAAAKDTRAARDELTVIDDIPTLLFDSMSSFVV
jgi:hypothetical protein